MTDEEITGSPLPAYFPPEFQVTDEQTCLQVLEALSLALMDVNAVDHYPQVAHARSVLERAEAIKQSKQKEFDYLKDRFEPQLADFAKTQFKKTSKTHKTVFGSVSIREIPATLKVKDERKVMQNYPSWVKETTVKVLDWAGLKEAIPTNSLSPTKLAEVGIESVPRREKITINLGVEE